MAATITNRGSIWNTTAGNKTVTATPAVGDLIVIFAPATGVATSAVSDNQSGVYVQVDIDRTGFSTAGHLTAWVRTAAIPAASSTVFTATQTSSTGGGLIVLSVSGMTVFGAAAVRSSGGQSAGTTGTTPAPVLSLTPNSANPILAAVCNGTNGSTTVTQRTGYTEDTDSGYNTPAAGFEASHLASGETTATITFGSTTASAFASMALEIAFNQAPTVALNSPANTATGVARTPQLQFTGTDNEADTITYEVQVDTANTFDSQSTNATLSPTQDTFYGTSFSTGPNGSATGLHIGGFGDSYQAFFQFDLSSIPANAVITAATLSLVIVSSNTTTPAPVVRRMTHSWLDTTLTKTLGGDELGTDTPLYWDKTITDGTFSSFTIVIGDINTVSILALVQGWFAGTITNNGLVVVPTLTSGTNHDIQVGSVENATPANRPTLSITYTLPLIDAFSVSGGHDTAQFVDITNGADTDPFASGDQIGMTIPAGEILAASTVHYWRVRGKDPSGSITYGAWATTRSFTTGTGGNSYTQTLSDTATFSDTLVRQETKVLSDTATLSDTLLKNLIRILSDTITYTDTLVASRIKFSVLTDTATFTDTLVRQGTKLLADTVTYTDTLIRKATKVLSDTITYADTLLKQLVRSLTETITYSDTITKFIAHFSTLSDTITFTDTLLKRATKVLSDTVTHTDTLLKQTVRTLTDTITYTDTLTAIKVAVRTLTDTITFTDTLVKQTVKLLSEIITYTDTVLKKTTRTLIDTVTYSDTLTALKLAARTLTDTITFSDTFIKTISRVLTETITYSDTLLKRLTRTLSDTITYSDTLIKQTTRTLSDIITYSDTLVKRLSKTLSETITYTDTVLKNAARTLSEVVTYSDTLLRRGGKTLSDTFTLTDTFVRQISKRFTETLSLIDTVVAANTTIVIAVLLSEVLTLADTVNKRIPKTLTEVITLTDTFLKSFVPAMKMAVLLSIYAGQTVVKKTSTAITLALGALSAILRAPEATNEVIEDTKKDATIKLNQ